MAPRGIYREEKGWVTQHSVLVDYGTTRFEISEEKYRQAGYEPAFEQLPWKDKAANDA
jgi:hypothetical protein